MTPDTAAHPAVQMAASPAQAQAQAHEHPLQVPVVPSAELLRGQKVVSIDHNGSLYRLQTTRQGKLILTK